MALNTIMQRNFLDELDWFTAPDQNKIKEFKTRFKAGRDYMDTPHKMVERSNDLYEKIVQIKGALRRNEECQRTT